MSFIKNVAVPHLRFLRMSGKKTEAAFSLSQGVSVSCAVKAVLFILQGLTEENYETEVSV